MSKRHKLISCFFLIPVLLISSCEQETQHEKRILSFGTLVDVTIYGTDETVATNAIAAIETELDVMHDQWHAWRPGKLRRLNLALQSGAKIKVGKDMMPLLKQSKELSDKSLGNFNPAIGKLIDLWGFHKDDPTQNKSPPNPSAINKLIESAPSMDDIEIKGVFARGKNSDIQLDFGGYAKGFGLEQLAHQLKSQDIHHALINAGGDIKILGKRGKNSWKIAIQHPETSAPLAWLLAEDGESIFTSGTSQRRFTSAGKTYHHIIDPETGYPSSYANSVTVIQQDGAIADAGATALMVAKPEQWLKIARSMNLSHIFIVDEQTIYIDDDLKDRLNLIDTTFSIETLGKLNQVETH